MAHYIKLFQKHQNLHLCALGGGNVIDKNCEISHPPKQDKTLIQSPQKETKTPEFFITHKQRQNNQKHKGSSVSYGIILDSVVRRKMSASSIKPKLLNPTHS
jgi:hypothetical protein